MCIYFPVVLFYVLRAWLCDQWKHSLWSLVSPVQRMYSLGLFTLVAKQTGDLLSNSLSVSLSVFLSLCPSLCASSQGCLAWEVLDHRNLCCLNLCCLLLLEIPIPVSPTCCHRLGGLWMKVSHNFYERLETLFSPHHPYCLWVKIFPLLGLFWE